MFKTDSSLPTLGVVAICRNEETDMPAFLKHLLPWVDEIVIVDDGSTDLTARLAQAAGPKVMFISSPRKAGEYFSDQRNKGIAAAKSDWLLHLDIDERITPELAQEIRRAIQDPAKDGYRCRRLNFFLHRPMNGGGWQKWNLVHLARREKFKFGGKMHETCLLDAPPERIGQLGHPIWHLNDDSYAERLRKSYTYSCVEAEDLIESGRQITWLHLLWPTLRTFIVKYLLQNGWRDGVPGLLLAIHSADATFRSYALAWDAQHRIDRRKLEQKMSDAWLNASVS